MKLGGVLQLSQRHGHRALAQMLDVEAIGLNDLGIRSMRAGMPRGA